MTRNTRIRAAALLSALAIAFSGAVVVATNCYYDLSQRSGITQQQEINAINNYKLYLARAQQAITKASLIYYRHILKHFSLRGLIV